ncbi:MAG: PIF1 family DEAD/DEAH box helicase [Candidatus Nomurabacteria bacterium]|nr:PIF1 family DEAD/DEAH box helicase [Candidatus Nomurabacteria bacterium]
MTQDQALNILKTGANIFLTGEPGAGKTHTINTFVDYLRSCDVEPAITASTGIAATHIGGMTIHSWSGIGVRKKLDKYDLDKITSSEYISRRILRTRVLIIDEISMLSTDMLDMVDAVCREVKQNDEAFGGIQIILVGDFFQLPPIVKKEEPNKQATFLAEVRLSRIFAYSSGAWERARPVVCYLSEQHRQDDADFLSLLSAIRADDVSEAHQSFINARQIDHDDMPENITKLFSHNVDVDRVNDAELAKLEEEKKSFKMSASGNEKLVETLKRGCLSPENLELKIGAVVMCTKNNPKERFVNGTLGTVIGYEEFSGQPIVKTRNGRNIVVAPMDWTVEENGKIRAQITQIPLRLAWAITVHKSQGMSMDAAVMDLSQVFEFGQGYVALSRVRRLSGLYLLGINEHALKVHPEILKKDIDFKKKSSEAEQVFGKILENDLKKMHENFVVACGGKIRKDRKADLGARLPNRPSAEPFSEIREKHPNAYRPWDKEQDEELGKMFIGGSSIPDLVKKFGRKRGGITARLKKLGLRE